MRLVIGICGRARHGKDTVAQVIKEELEDLKLTCFHSSVSAVVFAEAQRLGLVSALSRETCQAPDLDTLVRLGHARRYDDPDFWLKRLTAQIEQSSAEVAIVPGIRFENEVAWIRSNNGILLRITRRNADGSLFIARDRDPNDPMETVLDRAVADYEITATTGQGEWLYWQGVSFANFVYESYLEEHVPDPTGDSTDFVPALAESGVDLRVLSTKGAEAVAQPYVAPRFVFKVMSGKPVGFISGCRQATLDRRYADHVETVLTLRCDDGVELELELKGVTFQ